MSDGIPFSPGASTLLDGLSPDLIARLLQSRPQSQQQAAPSLVDSLLFDRAGMGAPDDGFSGSSGTVVAPQPPSAPASMVGARLPTMAEAAQADTPAPQVTGALPKPPASAPQAEEPPAPQAAAPTPSARPSDLSALGGVQPVSSFDPLTGQPVSGSPKPIAAAQGAPSPGGFDLGGALKRLNQSGLADQLIAMGAGILQGGNFGEGLGRGLQNALAVSQSGAKAELERQKLAREQANLTGNAALLKRAYPNLSDAELAAMASNSANVSTALQILRDPTHGMPKTPEQIQAEAAASARGSMEGGAKPLDRVQSEAQAQAAGTMAGNAKPLDRIEAEAKAQAAGTAAGRPDDDEGATLAAQIEVRRQKAAGLGLVEGSPAWQSFVGTGKIGRDQDLSATDKKAIMEGEDTILAHKNTLTQLNRAMELSKKAYDGAGAGARAMVVSNIPGMLGGHTPESLATREYANVVTGQALDNLKATFGGAPTEGERAILLQVQGSADMPQALREQVLQNAIAKAQQKLDFEQQRVDQLRGGTYYKKQGGPAQASPQSDAASDAPSRIMQLRTADEYAAAPSGTRFIAPDGKLRVKP